MNDSAKFSKGNHINDDRLSALPDEILCKILSLLSTTNAVATSALSTRWKYLCRSIPNIVLDDDSLPKQAGELEVNNFTGFVDRVLSLRNIGLVKFHLRCNRMRETSKINLWMCVALWHHVQDLSVFINQYITSPPLSSEVFHSKSLVSLKLYGFVMHVPKMVSLLNLKVLKLETVTFMGSDKCFQRLLEGCPSLKDLHLFDISLPKVKTIDFSSHSLTKLFLAGLWSASGGVRGYFSIILDNPNLVHLNISYVFGKELIVKNFKSLTEARLGFLHFGNIPCVSEFIYECYNVKVLSLSGMESAEYLEYPLPMFQNLIKLEITPEIPLHLKICLHMLDQAPHLLTLLVDMRRIGPPNGGIVEYQRPLNSKLDSLREVEIVDCHGYEYEMHFVEYLLQFGEALKVLEFTFSDATASGKDLPYSAIKRLATCPRSSTCRILLP